MHSYANLDTTTMNNNNNNNMVAPFIIRTYHMVNDPTTNHLIAWGEANNTFVVIEPLEFSRNVLPSYFKHNNFSSFVRQLNTYGFKKVDPDRWEFANEWFLRGQKHLLGKVVRRKNGDGHHQHRRSSGGDAVMEREIERLKREQSEMEEALRGMTRRLEAIERRPEQTVAFLCKVVGDPEILTRVMIRRDPKKRRMVLSAAEEEWSCSDGFRSPSTEVVVDGNCGGVRWFEGGGIDGIVCVNGERGVAAVEDGGDVGDGEAVELAAELEARQPPYPFSLFRGGI